MHQRRLIFCPKLAALLVAASFLGLGVSSPQALANDAATPTPSADESFKAIYTREWTWRQAQFAGEDDEDSHKGVADHLPHVDKATQLLRQRYWQDVLVELKAIDVAHLSADAALNFAIYREQIETLLASQRFRDYEKPLNADTSFWTNLAGTARDTFHSSEDYEHYAAWLRDLPRYVDEQIVNMAAGLARGFTPPKVTLTGRESSLTVVTAAPSIESNPYYAPYLKMPSTISTEEQLRLQAIGRVAIEEAVLPAYRRLLSFYRDKYVPGARRELAATRLPDGKAYYQSKIHEFTTLDLSPEEIHAIGLREVAEIHGEMLAVMKETGFGGDFGDFLHELRSDPKFYAKTPEELLMRAAFIAKDFDAKAAEYFGYLPRARFAIKPVPPDMAPFYTAGRGGPGVYLLNTYDLPSRPLYALTALTLHESAPGHAFQMPISLEHKGQPEFRQKSYLSGYGEGWALYCEKLGLEMGMYKTPYDRFGMLTYQMWRAARLVVDTGIHAKGWTREQAQRYLHDNTALSDHEIETEVDRYISWPGQALAYYLGEMTLWNARHRAEQELGAKFNLRAFHDAVLEMGSVPLPMIDVRIDRLIKEEGRGPYPDLE